MSLFRGDDQKGDWYGWATNQAGHAALIGMPAALVLLALGMPALATPPAIALAYAVAWEWTMPGPGWIDSLTDTLNVAAGAAILCTALGSGLVLTAAVTLAWLAVVAFGVWRRL